jgi:hypothetical protein
MGSLADRIIGQSGELFREVDSIPELRGAGAGVIDWQDQACRVVREPARGGQRLWVILEIQYAPKAAPAGAEYWNDARVQALKSDGLSAFFGCGSAVLSGIVLVGEAGGALPSAGATIAAMPLTAAAGTAGAAQCGISLGRIINVLKSETGADANKVLDDSVGYKVAVTALDIIQVADIVKSAPKLIQGTLRVAKGGGAAGASRKAIEEAVAKMSEAERRALYQEVQQFSKKAIITEKQVEYLVTKGVLRARWAERFRESLLRAIRVRLAAVVGNALNVTGSATTDGSLDADTWRYFKGVVVHVLEAKS